MEELTYEQMLSELQALLGQPITAEMSLTAADGLRPLLFLHGELRRGQSADMGSHDGAPTPFPPGETVIFSVGDQFGPTAARFFLVREGFVLGGKMDDGTLFFHAGDVLVSVGRAPTRA